MQAGELDRRIELRRATTVTDATGGETRTWFAIATVWASKQDVRDAERVRAQEVGATITTRFQIRWSSDVADLDASDELVCEGRTYAIEAVKEIGRRDGLEITAAARAERG
jgi:SPP1 family predicted phage head-tail adaptor